MLLLPFILVAFAAGFSQSLRTGARPLDAARAPSLTAPGRSAPSPSHAASALPRAVPVAPSQARPTGLPAVAALPQVLRSSAAAPGSLSTVVGSVDVASALSDPAPTLPRVAAPAISSSVDDAARVTIAVASTPAPVAPSRATDLPLSVAALAPPAAEIAAITVPDPAPSAADPAANVCPAPARGLAVASPPPAIAPPRDPAAFGTALAAAALAQTREFVVYNDKYRRIAYPMGDVPSFYGVCTDVLIRAYRALSIDLQALVQQTRSGSGDANIDHRRVDTLRRFFAAHGQSIPITEFAEDYRPGDIVSYWRPQNRHSRTHIAIVANEIGPSGRPMIIHNRGWGPQLEDGLFVDQITGHYRFIGLRSAPASLRSAGAGMESDPGHSAAASSLVTPMRGAARSAGAHGAARRVGISKAAGIPANAATP